MDWIWKLGGRSRKILKLCGALGKFALYFFLKKTTAGILSSLVPFFQGTSLVATYWIYGGKSFQYQCSFQLKFPVFSSNLLEVRFEGSDVQFLTWQIFPHPSAVVQEEVQANVRVSWGPTSYASLGAGKPLDWIVGWGNLCLTWCQCWLVGWLPRLPRLVPHRFGLETPHLHDFGSQKIWESKVKQWWKTAWSHPKNAWPWLQDVETRCSFESTGVTAMLSFFHYTTTCVQKFGTRRMIRWLFSCMDSLK